jgi:hypothetical protein
MFRCSRTLRDADFTTWIDRLKKHVKTQIPQALDNRQVLGMLSKNQQLGYSATEVLNHLFVKDVEHLKTVVK